MKLAKALARETVFASLEARDRHGALAEMARGMVRAGIIGGGEDLLRELDRREERESTGIGGGIAIPHARLLGISSLRLAVGRSVGGVDYGAIDGGVVHLIFLLLSPEGAADEYLCALARLTRLVREPALRAALLTARGREEMLEILVREDDRN